MMEHEVMLSRLRWMRDFTLKGKETRNIVGTETSRGGYQDR